MSIETEVLSAVVFGGATIVMIISFVLAKFEDEARRMARADPQLHYASEME